MKIARVSLKSIAPYSQSRHHATEKMDQEGSDDYEKRTWRGRMHVTEDGYVFLPPMAFRNCLSEAAKFLSVQIPGKGKSTYTKHFEAGLLIMDPIILPLRADEVEGEWLFVPADGKRGSGRRVYRCFPKILSWAGDLTIYVLDETITQQVLRYHLDKAGQFIGVGRFRPRNNGFYGRFEVTGMRWMDEA